MPFYKIQDDELLDAIYLDSPDKGVYVESAHKGYTYPILDGWFWFKDKVSFLNYMVKLKIITKDHSDRILSGE